MFTILLIKEKVLADDVETERFPKWRYFREGSTTIVELDHRIFVAPGRNSVLKCLKNVLSDILEANLAHVTKPITIVWSDNLEIIGQYVRKADTLAQRVKGPDGLIEILKWTESLNIYEKKVARYINHDKRCITERLGDDSQALLQSPRLW